MLSYERLYHLLLGFADDAVTLLEEGKPDEAHALLKRGLLLAEEQYINDAEDIVPPCSPV